MTSLYPTTVDNFPSTNTVLHIPSVGVWVLTCVVPDDEFKLSERMVIAKIGTQSFVGMIDVDASGEYLKTKQVRIIGGHAGWRKPITHSSVHNDAKVKRQTLAVMLSRQIGEELGDSITGTVGIDYGWQDGIASNVLESICPEWRVGYDGKTYLNAPSTTQQPDDIVALDYDKNAQTVILGLYESMPCPGMVITDERFGSVTVRSLVITATESMFQAVAWFGAVGRNRLSSAVEAIVKSTQRGLWGIYRYRVVSMNSDKRVNLQAVKSSLGLPDMLPVTQCPGLPGWKCKLTMGSVVLVQFIDGDPTLPRITGYHEPTDGGFIPEELAFGDGTRPIARAGDTINLPTGTAFSMQFNGFTGIATLFSPIMAIISSGRSDLKA